jgi:hypothetical protein
LDVSVDKNETALELYKVTAERLTFQDEYLFKFSALFFTAEGALAVAAEKYLLSNSLAVFGLAGIVLSAVWACWMRHNDYWHSVWTGVLIQIEKELDSVKVYSAPHSEIAANGGRTGSLPSGHGIALIVPIILLLAWAFVFMAGLCTHKHGAAQQGAPADRPASASLQRAGG